MAKTKFSLSTAPTFRAKVAIPIPGKTAEPVEFTFKARTRDEFREFVDQIQNADSSTGDVDTILDIASGWELADPFDREHIELLTQNYLGAAKAVIETYFTELTQARIKN